MPVSRGDVILTYVMNVGSPAGKSGRRWWCSRTTTTSG
jgi:hypothetical protein